MVDKEMEAEEIVRRLSLTPQQILYQNISKSLAEIQRMLDEKRRLSLEQETNGKRNN